MIELEYGEYTCFHIAHHEAWKRHLHEKQQDVIEQLARYFETPKAGDQEQEDTPSTSKKRRARK